jgi:hypothetical protein
VQAIDSLEPRRVGGDDPRPHEKAISRRLLVGRGLSSEQVPDGQPDRSQLERTPPVAGDVEPPAHSFERRERPGIAQALGDGIGSLDELRFAHHDPVGCGVIGP